jgi:hypothetical protein
LRSEVIVFHHNALDLRPIKVHLDCNIASYLLFTPHTYLSASSLSSTLIASHDANPVTNVSSLQVERAERVSEREEPSATARFLEITSRVSPSPPSVVLLAVEVSSVSAR